MAKRIIVTGGSGVVGRHVVSHLIKRGHEVLNIDLVPLAPGLGLLHVHTLKVDLSDAGQTFSALSSHFRLTEPFRERLRPADAIVHLAGYPRNMVAPDTETFRGNTISTYNVIEAACKLGIPRIILASSVCVYGVTYAEGDVDFPSFPVDEGLDINPTDVYSISKLCGERVARSYAKKFGVDIYVLRIGAVICPDDYTERFNQYVHHYKDWKVHGWSYVDARDLGQMCHRGVITNGLGFQIFNATNDENTAAMHTETLLKQECPSTPLTREMGLCEAPISNKKIKELLGFEEEHSWREYYDA